MKFTLIQEDGYDDTKITHEFNAIDHFEVTRGYIDFLRGCGFILPKQRDTCNFDVADILKPPKC